MKLYKMTVNEAFVYGEHDYWIIAKSMSKAEKLIKEYYKKNPGRHEIEALSCEQIAESGTFGRPDILIF